MLARLGLIVLIDPNIALPEWMSHRDRKLANRGGKRPIWMPTAKPMSTTKVWSQLRSELKGGEIVWSIVKPSLEKEKQETIH
jgi:hypothetical protein